MKFTTPLIDGTLVRRYKRFLADVQLKNGEVITAHCPNSGSMKSCNIPGSLVLLSYHDNPSRKFRYTWEMINIGDGWIGINTGHPNKLVAEAISGNQIPELTDYPVIKPEVRVGKNSRIDLMLQSSDGQCYVEIKNVTLLEDGQARFPDAVTERGQKHLRELASLKKAGHRTVIFFVVQRMDAESFAPADDIDPAYGKLLRDGIRQDQFEALAYQWRVTPEGIFLSKKLPVVL